MTPEHEAHILTEVDRALTVLSEHFDTLQFVGTVYDPSNHTTSCMHRGLGNYFGRLGSVVDWAEKQRAQAECEVHEDRRMDEDD